MRISFLTRSSAVIAIALLATAAQLPAAPVQDNLDPVIQWSERVGSANLRERLAASYDFETMASVPAESVPGLVAALHHPNPAVREHAAAALGEIPDPSGASISALMAALKDKDAVVQGQAALALAKIGESAGAVLIESLLKPEALTEPTANAQLWEDYAFAALKLMEERSARPLAAGLASLARFSHACEPQSHGHELRPGYSGDELKFQLLFRLAQQAPPSGGRILAAELISKARLQSEENNTKLKNIAFEILATSQWRGAGFVDSDSSRTKLLTDFLGSHSCSDSGPAIMGGDIALTAIDQALAAGSTEHAADLIGKARIDGAASAAWSARLEKYLSGSDPKIQQAAINWIVGNSANAVPVSEKLLLPLASSEDAKEAMSAAEYLIALGQSEQGTAAIANLLRRPGLDESVRSVALNRVRYLGPAAAPLEPELRILAQQSLSAPASYRRCIPFEVLEEIGTMSEETRAVLIEAVKANICVSEAVGALAQQGMTADQLLVATGLPASAEQAEQIRDAYVMLPQGEPGTLSPWTRVEPNEPEADLDRALLLKEIETRKVLDQRTIEPSSDRPAPAPSWFPRAKSVRVEIDRIERLNSTEVDQRDPLFAALADLKIFELTQSEVAHAARLRLELANPEEPPTARAIGAETIARLLPKWPWSWPPPKYSAWSVLTLASLPAKPTIGTVFDRLTVALERSGLKENRVYGIPAGVAIVTRVEAVGSDGKPLAGADRFSESGGLSAIRFLTETFCGIRKSYRMFAFFMTPQANISGGQSSLLLDQARNPSVDGARVLPAEIRAIPWNGFHLHALTYRFNKVNSKVSLVTADLPSTDQLRGDGVMLYLAGNS